MKKLHYSLLLTLPLMACAVQTVPAQPAPQAVRVQYRAEHPAYLHALSDLRAARWLLSHRPGDLRVTVDEQAAVDRINEGINEIKRAAFDDGKNLDELPPLDQRLDGRGRLSRAMELLRKARMTSPAKKTMPMSEVCAIARSATSMRPSGPPIWPCATPAAVCNSRLSCRGAVTRTADLD